MYLGEFSCWEDVLAEQRKFNRDDLELPVKEPEVIIAFKNLESSDSLPSENRYVVYILNGKYYEAGYYLRPYQCTKEEILGTWSGGINLPYIGYESIIQALEQSSPYKPSFREKSLIEI